MSDYRTSIIYRLCVNSLISCIYCVESLGVGSLVMGRYIGIWVYVR